MYPRAARVEGAYQLCLREDIGVGGWPEFFDRESTEVRGSIT